MFVLSRIWWICGAYCYVLFNFGSEDQCKFESTFISQGMSIVIVITSQKEGILTLMVTCWPQVQDKHTEPLAALSQVTYFAFGCEVGLPFRCLELIYLNSCFLAELICRGYTNGIRPAKNDCVLETVVSCWYTPWMPNISGKHWPRWGHRLAQWVLVVHILHKVPARSRLADLAMWFCCWGLGPTTNAMIDMILYNHND